MLYSPSYFSIGKATLPKVSSRGWAGTCLEGIYKKGDGRLSCTLLGFGLLTISYPDSVCVFPLSCGWPLSVTCLSIHLRACRRFSVSLYTTLPCAMMLVTCASAQTLLQGSGA